jgi:hypothetical protein
LWINYEQIRKLQRSRELARESVTIEVGNEAAQAVQKLPIDGRTGEAAEEL